MSTDLWALMVHASLHARIPMRVVGGTGWDERGKAATIYQNLYPPQKTLVLHLTAISARFLYLARPRRRSRPRRGDDPRQGVVRVGAAFAVNWVASLETEREAA